MNESTRNLPIGDLMFLNQFLAEPPPVLLILVGRLLAETGNKTCDVSVTPSLPSSMSSLLFGLRGISLVVLAFGLRSR